jgi:uncharacterized membrane protein YsdA (DUF1294 family)
MSDQLIIAWLAGSSLWALALFGADKWRAHRGAGARTAESTLLLASALGGWPGGLLGILVFRHKSAKASFLFKFAVMFLPWAALVGGVLKFAGRI